MTGPVWVFFMVLLGNLFALSAPMIVPIALLFTSRTAKSLPKFFSWYDTPDEDELIGMYEETVKAIHDKYGWFAAAYYWFGLRNLGHGFVSMFSRRARWHWPNGWDLSTGNKAEFFKTASGEWIRTTRKGNFIVFAGWQVYASRTHDTGLEYRPVLSIKHRPSNAA